jgi:endonuclease YncB( thermonuclease family)
VKKPRRRRARALLWLTIAVGALLLWAIVGKLWPQNNAASVPVQAAAYAATLSSAAPGDSETTAGQPIPPTFSAPGTVNRSANLRAGPGAGYERSGGAARGQRVTVTACNAVCDWYRLDTGAWIAAFLVDLAATPAATPETGPQVPAGATPATVTGITDGDTIRVRVSGAEFRLRYIGIDTPEVGQPCYDAATAANAALVAGQTVYLEKDVSETDRYGRLLRYVWLEDGRLVNEELVRQGFAAASTYPPDVRYQARLAAAQRAAAADGVVCGADPAAAETSKPAGPRSNATANLRAGPGTSYARIGSVAAGATLAVTGRNGAGDWLQLADGTWIAAFLVDGAPGGLPVVVADPIQAPPRSGEVAAPVVVEPGRAAQAGACDAAYPDVCIPPPPPDLNCGDIADRRFTVLAPDPHNFDGDRDGVGCER